MMSAKARQILSVVSSVAARRRSSGSRAITSAMTSSESSLDQFRIEPAVAAVFHCVKRCFGALGGPEDLQSLSEVGDVGGKRYFFLLQAIRIASAVSVLIEAVNSRGHAFREAEFAGDGGAAFAANLYKLAGVALLGCGYLDEFPDALGKRSAGGDVGERVVETLPAHFRPVHRFKIALGPKVVGIKNVIKARGVAAAACVLEEQGVVQVSLGFGREANLLADAHSKEAGADRVPHGPPFR